jgi:hypothetical protein
MTEELVTWAYGLTNALRVASYAPQIWRVARDREGAQAISCLSWNLWVAANATTALYAGVRLHDAALVVINAANALCCLSVVLITLVKRRRWQRRLASAARPVSGQPASRRIAGEAAAGASSTRPSRSHEHDRPVELERRPPHRFPALAAPLAACRHPDHGSHVVALRRAARRLRRRRGRSRPHGGLARRDGPGAPAADAVAG